MLRATHPSPLPASQAVGWGMVLSGTTYATIGISGFMVFGQAVQVRANGPRERASCFVKLSCAATCTLGSSAAVPGCGQHARPVSLTAAAANASAG